MKKPKRQRPPKPVPHDVAVRQLPDALQRRAQLTTAYDRAYLEFCAAHDELSAKFQAMAGANDELVQHKTIIDRLKAAVDAGPGADYIEKKAVPDPSMSDAEKYAQLDAATEEEKRYVGLIVARRNMATYVGGFARFQNRKDWQDMAAAKFLTLYERSQLGGAKASDASQPFVDRSGPSEDRVLVVGDDARRDYAAMAKAIGKQRERLLHQIIVEAVSLRKIVAERAGRSASDIGGRAVVAVTEEVFEAITVLAEHFRFKTREREHRRA